MFLSAIAFILMILSISSKHIFGKDIQILPFLSFIIFSVLAVSSNNVQIPYCESSTNCFYQTYGDVSMMTFFAGMGLFMLVFGIFSIFVWTKEEVEDYAKKLQ